MVRTKDRHGSSRQAAASSSSSPSPKGVPDASVAQSSSLEMDQPLPGLDLLVTSDKLGPARGLVTGLTVSMMVWAAVALFTWQHLR